MIEQKKIPTITFMCRVGDEEPEDGGCPIGGEFVPTTTDQLFAGKRVIVFSLPGAFTPTCSSLQLPAFEQAHEDFYAQGIDEIYVSSVNDSFVMNAWAQHMGIKKVKVIPDGNGEFADSLGMLADMSVITFGKRSRRFAVVINDGVVERSFVEPDGTEENPDPYGVSSPAHILKVLSDAPGD
jgi:thioredoxin-dependent peroxiredoxin